MSDTTTPEQENPEFIQRLIQFAQQPQVLICLDFDGCVAELVDDADAARPVPATAAVINELAAREGVTLAYVSGRGLETLRKLASPPSGVALIGSHGAETDLGNLASPSGINNDGASPGLQLTSEQQRAKDTVTSVLQTVAAQDPGAWVEHKPAGAALHVRTVTDPGLRKSLLDQGLSAVEQIDGAYPRHGKDVLETVVVHSSKGEGIEKLRQIAQPDAVFFAGDDVTDEQGFAVLSPETGDIGVKVGPGETAAQFRIPEPAALAGVLEQIRNSRK